jgi:transposase-like protein
MGSSSDSPVVNGTKAGDHTEYGIDVEVEAKPRRRRFSAEYKLRILREADELAKTGGVGSLLRREGLYSSHLAAWRREREQGGAGALAKKRGRKPTKDPGAKEIRRLSAENERLRRRLAQAEAIIEVQKKVAGLLGIPLKSPGDDGSDS